MFKNYLFHFFKLNFCSSKLLKRRLREYKVYWKAGFMKHMSEKILTSKIYKERTLRAQYKKMNNPIKIGKIFNQFLP